MAIGTQSRLSREKIPSRRRQVHDGTDKTLFEGTEPDTYVLYFKDDCIDIAGNPTTIVGKGAINNRISELLMTRLGDIGVSTHFIKRLNMREQLVQATDALPVTLSINNIAVGEFAKRLGLDENFLLQKAIPEFKYKSKELGNPVVSPQHIVALGWAREDEIEQMLSLSQRINDYLTGQFLALGFRLAQFTMEFGRLYNNEFFEDIPLILIDELSPDTFTLIDLTSGAPYDFDARPHLYQEIGGRLGLLTDGGPLDLQESVTYLSEDTGE